MRGAQPLWEIAAAPAADSTAPLQCQPIPEASSRSASSARCGLRGRRPACRLVLSVQLADQPTDHEATPCTQPTHMHGVAAMPAALTREDHARSGTTVGPCCRWACTTPQGLARLRTNVTTVLERAQEAHPISSYAMDARKLDGLRDTCQPCRNAQLASARGSMGALLAAPQPGYMRVPRSCPHITLSWPSSCPIVRLSALQAHSADRHAAALSVRHAS